MMVTYIVLFSSNSCNRIILPKTVKSFLSIVTENIFMLVTDFVNHCLFVIIRHLTFQAFSKRFPLIFMEYQSAERIR